MRKALESWSDIGASISILLLRYFNCQFKHTFEIPQVIWSRYRSPWVQCMPSVFVGVLGDKEEVPPSWFFSIRYESVLPPILTLKMRCANGLYFTNIAVIQENVAINKSLQLHHLLCCKLHSNKFLSAQRDIIKLTIELLRIGTIVLWLKTVAAAQVIIPLANARHYFLSTLNRSACRASLNRRLINRWNILAGSFPAYGPHWLNIWCQYGRVWCYMAPMSTWQPQG